MKISEELLNDAIKAGLCKEHTIAWNKDWTLEDLVAYYKANPDWCLERHYPSIEYLRKNFDNETTKDLGVYVDGFITIRAVLLSYVFNGSRVGMIVDRGAVRVYLGLKSIAKFIVKDGADLTIDYYDDSEVEVELQGSATCTIYRYGENIPVVKGSKKYKIKDKRR